MKTMCMSGRALAAAALTASLALGLAGCNQGDRDTTPDNTPQTTERESHDKYYFLGSHYSPEVGEGEAASALAFPTGDMDTSALLLHTVAPVEVAADEAFTYSLHVTNLTRGTLQNVVLTQSSIDNMSLVSSDPSFSRGGNGNAVWALGDLGPDQTRVVTVRAEALSTGSTQACLSVSYNNVLCFSTNVVNPDLTISKTLPQSSLICDQFVMSYEICNPGSGSTGPITVVDTLPAGLETTAGTRRIEFQAEPLASGACATYEVDLRATDLGTFGSSANASTTSLSADSNEPRITIVQPALELACQSRDRVFLGRPVTFDFTVSNTGDAPSANTVVSAAMPSGVEFVSATANGARSGGNVQWNVGSLAAGASRTVSMTVMPRALGSVSASASASGVCADTVSTSCSTDVQGIPALLLEVVDIDDPIEVGGQTTYVITVTNQGSAVDTNIEIVVTLPPEQSLVQAGGATNATSQGRTVRFAPLASLAAKAKAEWRVTVSADAQGDVRFGVEMNSDQLTSPVRETESTNLYN